MKTLLSCRCGRAALIFSLLASCAGIALGSKSVAPCFITTSHGSSKTFRETLRPNVSILVFFRKRKTYAATGRRVPK